MTATALSMSSRSPTAEKFTDNKRLTPRNQVLQLNRDLGPHIDLYRLMPGRQGCPRGLSMPPPAIHGTDPARKALI